MNDGQTVIAVCALAGMVLAIFLALRSLFKGKTPQQEEQRAREDSGLRFIAEDTTRTACCACGEPATEPMPVLKRDRGTVDVLRKLYAAPPRYVRFVDKNAPLALCQVHAHVADAKMDEFIFQRVRGIFAEANAKVAIEAASFERESLLKCLNDSLTDREKKALRKPASGNVVSIVAAADGREASG
jgi:hypothetical protein